MPLSLGELAVRFGCELHGDPDVRVDRVAALQTAGPGAASFLANPKYRKHLAIVSQQPFLDRIEFRPMPDAGQRVQALRSGAVNMLLTRKKGCSPPSVYTEPVTPRFMPSTTGQLTAPKGFGSPSMPA